MDRNAMTISHSNDVVNVDAGNASSRGKATLSFGGSENQAHSPLAAQRKGPADFENYEYNVAMICELERGDHITPEQRTKLLTWYSVTADERTRRIVNAYISTLGDNPSKLATQLRHSFPAVFDVSKKPRIGF